MRTRKPNLARHGAILPMVAIMLPVTLAIAAFAINIAYLELNRTEMFVATDAAARAAGREFALKWDQAKARAAGKDAAKRNTIGGKQIDLQDTDFVFGEANRPDENSRYIFKKGGSNPNAVEVNLARTASSGNGALSMVMPFGNISGSVDAIVSSRSSQVEADIALVIDRSGSMAYAATEKSPEPGKAWFAPTEDLGWFFGMPAPSKSRWRDAVSGVDVFLAEINKTPMKELVTLVTYATDAKLNVNLSTVYPTVQTELDKYTKSFGSGKTNIAGGLDLAVTSLTGMGARQFSSKVIVLLTDGKDTTGTDLTVTAKKVADKQIMLFTITFSDEADKVTMANIAKLGLGKHFHAQNAADLQMIFGEIARQIPVVLTK